MGSPTRPHLASLKFKLGRCNKSFPWFPEAEWLGTILVRSGGHTPNIVILGVWWRMACILPPGALSPTLTTLTFITHYTPLALGRTPSGTDQAASTSASHSRIFLEL